MRENLREIHLEKHALCHNRVIARPRPMIQKRLTSGRISEALSELRKEHRVGLYRRHIPAERCHACCRIADSGADFQNTADILSAQPAKYCQRGRRAAGMQVTHAQPGAKLMILEGGLRLADLGLVFSHTRLADAGSCVSRH